MISLFALLLASVALPAATPRAITTSSPQNPCPSLQNNGQLVDPPAIYSKNGVLDLTLTLTEQIVDRFPALCWTYALPVNGKIRQLSVPPTLNVRQGERLSITLVNSLSPPNGNLPTPPPIEIDRGSSASKTTMRMPAQLDPYALMCGQPQLAPTPTPDPITGRVYAYHRSPWNEANLHFHGLNTSPQQPSDDVVDVLLCPHFATPAKAYHYVVDIPSDEPPGLYWYHPHAHGEALYQVFQGLTGAIIVHTVKPSVPDKLSAHLAIIRDAAAHQGIAKYPRNRELIGRQPNLTRIRTQLASLKRRPGPDPFQPPDRCPGPHVPFNNTNLTVNGLSLPRNGDLVSGLPQAQIGLGETQYWRLANTDGQTTLDLVLLINGKVRPLMVTARDGVPLIVKNGQPTYQAVAMDHVVLAPASRVEFYLTGSVSGANIVIRTQAIDTGCVGDTDLARNLFYVKVGTQRTASRLAAVPRAISRPQRFSDIGAQQPIRKRTFVFTEYLRSDEPEPDFYITEVSNPQAVEHPYRMSGPPDTIVKDGTVEEWTFYNYTNEIHAFHIHQIHFMPTAGVDVPAGLGQILDTVLIPHGGYDAHGKFQPRAVRVLMDFRAADIVGTFVYHCHFLEHEDGGMMARIQVVK